MRENTDLVFVDYPALKLLVPALVALTVLDDLVDRKVFQARPPRELFAMCRLTHARRAGDDNVRSCSRHFLVIHYRPSCDLEDARTIQGCGLFQRCSRT